MWGIVLIIVIYFFLFLLSIANRKKTTYGRNTKSKENVSSNNASAFSESICKEERTSAIDTNERTKKTTTAEPLSLKQEEPKPSVKEQYTYCKNEDESPLHIEIEQKPIISDPTFYEENLDDITEENIIDVSDAPYLLKDEVTEFRDEETIPCWINHYVYSTNSLNYANSKQKRFYYYFKEQFNQGNFIDLEGNLTYAFILLFDFIDTYDTNKNTNLILERLSLLAKHYPKTQRYCISNLRSRSIINDSDDHSLYQILKTYPIFAEGFYEKGFQLLAKYELSFEEVQLLNKSNNPLDSFISHVNIPNAMEYFTLLKKHPDLCLQYYGYGYKYLHELNLNIDEFTLLNWCWNNIYSITDIDNEPKLEALYFLIKKHPQLISKQVFKDKYPFIYFEELNLSLIEFKLLHLFTLRQNTFTDIEGTIKQIIRVFTGLIREFNKVKETDNPSIEEVLHTLGDAGVKQRYNFRRGSKAYKESLVIELKKLVSCLARISENGVRDVYKHTRKLSIEWDIQSEPLQKQFLNDLIKPAESLTKSIAPTLVLPPTKKMELVLNKQNTARWRFYYNEILSKNLHNPSLFYKEIVELGKENKHNPSVERIFYTASKDIAKTDKTIALSLYIIYIYHDLKSDVFDNRKMTKTMKKLLFNTDEQLQSFKAILEELIQDHNLTKALTTISEFYSSKRKRVSIDKESIVSLRQDFKETVNLLNEYLEDEDFSTDSKTQSNSVPIKTSSKDNEYIEELRLDQKDVLLLDFFVSNQLVVKESQLNDFAQKMNLFSTSLIDNLNEKCYEYLDDVLIEEEENFVIYEDNYKSILK